MTSDHDKRAPKPLDEDAVAPGFAADDEARALASLDAEPAIALDDLDAEGHAGTEAPAVAAPAAAPAAPVVSADAASPDARAAASPSAASASSGVFADDATAATDEPVAARDDSVAGDLAGADAPAQTPLSYRPDTQGSFRDPVEALEPVAAAPLLFDDDGLGAHHAQQDRDGRPRHAKEAPEPSAFQVRTRRVRRRLIAIIVVLMALTGGLVYLGYSLLVDTQNSARELADIMGSRTTDIGIDNAGEDASSGQATRTVHPPNLAGVLGLSQSEALERLGHGAQVVRTVEASESEAPVVSHVTATLTADPADVRAGSPAVYLGLDESGAVVQVGYSASVSALGYGDVGFSDLVNTSHVVEATLREVGFTVEDGQAKLPADASEYTTYAANGTTVQKQHAAFEGDLPSLGAQGRWSAVLSYDYALANMQSGSVRDTVRMVYVYATAAAPKE
ncbi:hypothetical protein HLV38_05560 [Berryella wangjianweii]|uniref:Uncharacterized protein n=1 Tax=Berryella wangjianweii TaxID=2734634 RepID=A0A6M8J3B8_9ACTN|nr:hypothetical protein [Berryella wangjianweii]QKF07641.1 hypothetical protein HLV38_05560 [Berryella wangjianweii]